MDINKDKILNIKFFSDPRGKIYINKIRETEFNVIFTKANVYRAGDYHSAKQYSIILRGEIELTLRQNNKDIIKKYGPNKLIVIPPDIPHLYKFLIDTVMIEWLSGPYKPQYYKPYRKIVNRNPKK